MIKADMINELKDKVIDGYSISRDEALQTAALMSCAALPMRYSVTFLTMTSICVPS